MPAPSVGSRSLFSFLSPALATAQQPKGPKLPDGVTAEANLSFGDHERNKFDLDLPKKSDKSDKPVPLVLWVHGGRGGRSTSSGCTGCIAWNSSGCDGGRGSGGLSRGDASRPRPVTGRNPAWAMDSVSLTLDGGRRVRRLTGRKVALEFSRPWQPTDNAFIESFHS